MHKTLTNVILIPLLLVLPYTLIEAQNISFAHFRQAPLHFNPALVAAKSEMVLSFQHKNTNLGDNNGFQTTALSGACALVNRYNKRWGGVGITAIRDVQNEGDGFKLQGAALAYAYNLNVYRHHYVSFGMQGGYYQRSIDMNRFTTGSQWIENVGFDRSAPLGENFMQDNKTYFTLTSGIHYTIEDRFQRQIFSFGYAAFHLNRPGISFYNEDDRLYFRHTAHTFLGLLKNEKILFGPEVIYQQQNQKDLLSPGIALSYNIKNDNPFSAVKDGSLDIRLRYTLDYHTLASVIQVHQPNFSVGFSYEVNIGSPENTLANATTTEFFIAIKKPVKRKKVLRYGSDASPSSSDRYLSERSNADSERYFDELDADSVLSDVAAFDWEKNSSYRFELKKDFHFDFNKAELDDAATVFLLDLYRLLKNNDQLYLEVIGHTDDIGTPEANKEVSKERATAVYDFLTNEGIDHKHIRISAAGAEKPLVANDSEANREKNRRIEFIIYTR